MAGKGWYFGWLVTAAYYSLGAAKIMKASQSRSPCHTRPGTENLDSLDSTHSRRH